MKYLSLYDKFINDGRMDNWGLCQSLRVKIIELEVFTPTGDRDEDSWYWGFDGERHQPDTNDPLWFDLHYGFTPLRQNIILFLAAIHGEL